MKYGLRWILLAGALTVGGASAQAEFIFAASLDPAQEVPAPDLPTPYLGGGVGQVVLNDAQDQITVDLAYFSLTGEATLAHIHGPAAPGSTAPPIFDLTPFLEPNPLDPDTGIVDGVTFAITPEQVQALFAGNLYMNVHTARNPTGEIRGQLVRFVPEPSTAALLGIGLIAALGLSARRKPRPSNA